jgi:TatD DNase family protein
MIEVVDTHTHLDEEDDIGPIISTSKAAGVAAIVCVGSGYNSNATVLNISQKYSRYVYAAMGLHPWEIHNLSGDMQDNLIAQIQQNIDSLAAIGEIGLDYDKRMVRLSGKEEQKYILKRLLALAARYDKPVSLHSRYAWKDCLELVLEAGVKKAVFHWFTGFSSVLREIISNGFYISCTPAAEYHEEHRRAVREAPLEQLLLETDSPVTYGRDNRYRSQPADVLRSLKAAALLKDVDTDTVSQQTTINARNLFKLD